ncbi:MAG: hypothetical protein WA082_04470 [Candidatus Moraniibacteriota bacterium]
MKRFKYDVFENDGSYITTWNDVVSDPNFSASVNGGLGETKVLLARNADDFGESDDVNFRNQVIVKCFDAADQDGVTIFNGWISGYTPVLKESSEYLEVTLMGYIQELSRVELLDDGTGIQDSPVSGNTKLTYTAQEIGDILKDIIDKYNALTGVFAKVDYTISPDSIGDTATTITYTFNTVTILQAINKLVEMCPAGWYWYLDADNVIHLAEYSATPNHTFFVGKDVNEIQPYKRIENVVNVAYVIGKETAGENLFRKYERTASRDNYGRSVIFITDNRISDAGTAEKFADASLDADDEPEVRTQVVIVDENNDQGLGYDIESVHPGNVVNILNFLSKKTYTLWGAALWNVDVWGYDISNVTATNINVVRLEYKPDRISIELSSKLPLVGNTINELRRRLELITTENNPDAAS